VQRRYREKAFVESQTVRMLEAGRTGEVAWKYKWTP